MGSQVLRLVRIMRFTNRFHPFSVHIEQGRFKPCLDSLRIWHETDRLVPVWTSLARQVWAISALCQTLPCQSLTPSERQPVWRAFLLGHVW